MHATTWVNLENIMLNEKIHSQNAMYCMIRFIWNVQKMQNYGGQKQMNGYLELGREWRVSTNWYEVSSWSDGDVLNLESGKGYRTP